MQGKAFHRSLTEINDYFARQDPEIAVYLKNQEKIYQTPTYRFKFISIILTRFRGEIVDVVILANGLICGGIILLALSDLGSSTINNVLSWTILAVLSSISGFYIYALPQEISAKLEGILKNLCSTNEISFTIWSRVTD